jgi:hypothetical protein
MEAVTDEGKPEFNEVEMAAKFRNGLQCGTLMTLHDRQAEALDMLQPGLTDLIRDIIRSDGSSDIQHSS